MTARTLFLLALLTIFVPAAEAEDILVASRFSNNVLRFDAQTGAFKGVFASGNGLANPNGLAIGPDGRLYVALGDVAVIMRFDGVSGAFVDRFVFDDPATTADETGGLSSPRAIAFGPEGDLYVASGGSSKIIRYDGRTGKLVGTAGEGNGLNGPVGVAVRDDGTVIAGGALSNGVWVFRNGTFLRRCSNPALHGTITGVLVARDGTVFAATAQRQSVLRVNVDTCQIDQFATGGGLNTGIYMNYDAAGNLLVGSFLNDTVVRFRGDNGDPLGEVMAQGAGGLDGTHAIVVAPEAPQAFPARLVVPGIARTAGAGSFFRTTMWIANPSQTASTVRLRFVPGAGFSASGAISPQPLVLGPGEMLTYPDVLTDVFRVTTDTGGVVVVEVADGSPTPLVTARTFNDTAQGTFGQYIQALRTGQQIGGDQWIHGLAADAQNRSNVGLVNLSEAETQATLTLYAPAGTKIGNDVSVTVPAGSSVQVNGVQNAAGAGTQSEFSVLVRSASSSVAAYASKLDNKTSDPIFIVPLAERGEQWIDGVGSIGGAGGTQFRSTLSIGNETSSAATVHIEYTRRGDTTPTASADVIVAANQTRFYNDVMADVFHLANTVGSLSLRSDRSVSAWTRTYNDRGEAGTLGQFIPAFGRAELIGTRGVVLLGLGENPDVRTNIGFMNVGTSGTDVRVEAIDSKGAVEATRTFRVESGQSIGVNRIFTELALGARSNMYLRITATDAGSVYAWASYVDNRSTDQTFVRPLAIP